MGGLKAAMPIIILFFSIVLLMGGFLVWYGIKQNKAIMERAKKIDPSVKTITDAHYVLQKDIAKSVGMHRNSEK